MRFRIKTLMVAIAIVALLIGTVMTWSRSKAFRLMADFHAQQENYHKKWARLAAENRPKAVAQAEADAARAVKSVEKAEHSRNEIARIEKKGAVTEQILENYRDLYRLKIKAAEMDAQFHRRTSQDHAQSAAFFQDLVDRESRLAKHHSFLKRKYNRAALMPWLSVVPDP